MQIEVPIEELRKRKLFVATPMFAGMCNGTYTQSMINLAIACVKYGIEMQVFYLFQESLISRGRAYCADAFLRSDCSHMLFIDSDISFEPDAALSMLALQSDESEYDVLAAPYAKKTIVYEKIKAAVDKGAADEDANNLANFVGDFVFNLANGVTQMRLDEPVEVLETGTGFMMIRRKTFEDYMKAYPEQMYLPDHVRTGSFDGSREICMFFDCIIDPKTKRYLSEDYQFCQSVRNMGGKVWLCPWIPLKHTGTFTFGGTLQHLASVGVSATYSENDGKTETQPVLKKSNKEKKILT